MHSSVVRLPPLKESPSFSGSSLASIRLSELKCYPGSEPATLLGFCLSMALPLAVLKSISPFDPSYTSPGIITDFPLYFKGLRAASSVFPSAKLLQRVGLPAILRFFTSS